MAAVVPGAGVENMCIWVNLRSKFVSSTESDAQGEREREKIEAIAKDV